MVKIERLAHNDGLCSSCVEQRATLRLSIGQKDSKKDDFRSGYRVMGLCADCASALSEALQIERGE